MKKHLLTLAIIVAVVAIVMADCDRKGTPSQEETVDLSEAYPDPVYADNGKMRATWGNTDDRIERTVRYTNYSNAFRFLAWKNEKVSAEAVLWAFEDLSNVSFKVSALKTAKGNVIPPSAISVHFVSFVIADTYDHSGGDCALRQKGQWPVINVADRLDNDAPVNVSGKTSQPVWVSVKVPKDAATGIYKGVATVTADDMSPLELPIMLKVGTYALPDPSEWKFQLDYWQHFEEVASYSGIEQWSDDYFDYMRPLMKLLSQAGQKCIYANISGAPSMTMVKKIKNFKDETWTYDYTVFDRWVTLMMELGITGQIDCYGMIPWAYNFDYYDTRGNRYNASYEPGTNAYNDYWTPFLKDFAMHLKEMGWFEKTYLAFDERPEEVLLKVIPVIRGAVPEFKVKHTGFYYESMDREADDICVVYLNDQYPEGVPERRRTEGKKSLYYTACGQPYPNQFLSNPVAENVWKCWAAKAMGLDGYLHWAYNKWGEDPLYDTRAIAAPAGDRFIVYPDCRSSVRFEKTIEGVQDYEKACILEAEWTESGNTDKLAKLRAALSRFTPEDIAANGAEPAVYQAKMVLE